jgi:hypothetical protein
MSKGTNRQQSKDRQPTRPKQKSSPHPGAKPRHKKSDGVSFVPTLDLQKLLETALTWLKKYYPRLFALVFALACLILATWALFHYGIVPAKFQTALEKDWEHVEIVVGLRDPNPFVLGQPITVCKDEEIGRDDEQVRTLGFDLWSDNAPKPDSWIFPRQQWTTKPGLGSDPGHQALVVTGPGIGIYSPEDPDESLFDFTVKFQVVVSEKQQSASWVIRAQKNLEDYYLFTLKFPNSQQSKLSLEGSVYKQGKPLRPLDNSPLPLPSKEFHPFNKDDIIYVVIEVTGNEFKHCLKLDCADLNDPNIENSGSYFSTTLTDPKSTYKYGGIGFGADRDDVELRIEDMKLLSAK